MLFSSLKNLDFKWNVAPLERKILTECDEETSLQVFTISAVIKTKKFFEKNERKIIWISVKNKFMDRVGGGASESFSFIDKSEAVATLRECCLHEIITNEEKELQINF